jgi:hypothetical protein
VLDPKDGGSVIIQNIGNYLSSDIASYPKKLVPSASLLGELQTLHEAGTTPVETFFASKGWCDALKQAACDCPVILSYIIKASGFASEFTFIVDEITLFWKRMMLHMLVLQEESRTP